MPPSSTESIRSAPGASPVTRRPEILAPAGDWECVRAAIENGADAVYFGLDRFNARMRAQNFTVADLPRLMESLHQRGVRGYVTFNTLVFSHELAEAEEYIRTLIAAGVDAAIVQDVGICRMIRALSADFPIHCSTQMTITSAAGIAFAHQLGTQLVVLARENSLAEIEKLQATLAQTPLPDGRPATLPLEVFVHGALCVAYSGQCLTSESLGGRSANRGECAQACRMPYELLADGQPVNLGGRHYLLSPQDLAGLKVLPDLIRLGITSLKIEGRLKSPEYVANITRVYRDAVDRLAPVAAANASSPGGSAAVVRSLEQEHHYAMEMAFSRGLYPGWFGGTNNQELVHARFGTKRGVRLGEVLRVEREGVLARLEAPLKRGDGIVFDCGTPEAGEQGGRVYDLLPREGDMLLRFGHGDIDFSRVEVGARIWKTNDPELDRRLRATYAGNQPLHTRPVAAEVHGVAGQPLTLMLRDAEGHIASATSSVALIPAETQPLTPERLREQIGRLGGTPFHLGQLEARMDPGLILPLRELNRVRREAVAQLEKQRAVPPRWSLDADGARRAWPQFTKEQAGPPEIIVVIHHLRQLEAVLAVPGVRSVYCDFENPKHYREAVARFRAARERSDTPNAARTIWVAPPRIFKPGDDWVLRQVRSCEADGYLVRNYDHLTFFANDRRRGDFSLNVANEWSADYFLRAGGLERVTASYDLNLQQLESMLRAVDPARLEITIHQHMPMFHMEHCLFCAFLTTGTDYTNCGRPCDRVRLHVRDRVGAAHPVKADAGCRNTVFNSRAQTGAEFVGRLLALGARFFRVEFLDEESEELGRVLRRYQQLVAGKVDGASLWREFKLLNQLGVTRGQLDAPVRAVAPRSTT